MLRNGISGLTVLESRHVGNPVRKLPVACVYLLSVNRTIESIGKDRTVLDEGMFEIDIHADKGSKPNVDDNLDDYYLEAVPLLESDRTLGGKAFHIYVESFEKDVSEEGEKPRGVAQITCNVTWYTNQSDT